MAEIKYIPVSKLWKHPDNPRKDLGDVTELAESIKVNGVLQNLTVVPLIGEITKKWDGESYRVIIGHRRLAAAKLAGLEELPCVVVEMSEREQLSTMLTENMQRSDLTVYEQAQGFQMMLNMGDSVAEILEEIGLERAGAPGTTAALALLNDQVKKGGVMAAAAVGGLSGAFIPVSEDQGMIDAVNEGALTLEKLEAMTCVCSVGLDMIAVPGDTKATTLAGIIADESAIGMVNQKTTAVRLIPVIGKGVGETVEFGGLLGYAPIMPVNSFSCDAFVQRGGRIPAPIHSFKN